MFDMRRREFITLLGGAAVAWPVAARAQQPGRMRRVGVLSTLPADDAEWQARLAALLQGLGELGWTVDRNVRIDYRLGADNAERLRGHVAELVALTQDVILANGTSVVGPLLQATRSVPIVFTNVVDPVGAGFVSSLARPGSNATGFTAFEYGMSGKYLEVLKQISPRTTRVAVIRDPGIASGSGQFGAIQAVGPLLGVEVSPVDARDAGEIERAVTEFARSPNGGLILTASGHAIRHRHLVIALAARHLLPAVYAYRAFATGGGLASYGHDATDSYRRAAGYIDRILKGEKPADLPVQAPTKYELVINLKTAKALGLDIPSTLLARADEVIE
jgi:putative tryptophan/tyrosine transport system substrate-binding protein